MAAVIVKGPSRGFVMGYVGEIEVVSYYRAEYGMLERTRVKRTAIAGPVDRRAEVAEQAAYEARMDAILECMAETETMGEALAAADAKYPGLFAGS